MWTQVGSLSYLEGRLNKMYEESRGKLRERRRQDVRDQADILAAQSAASFSLSMDLVQVRSQQFRKKRKFREIFRENVVCEICLKFASAFLASRNNAILFLGIWSRILSDPVFMAPDSKLWTLKFVLFYVILYLTQQWSNS